MLGPLGRPPLGSSRPARRKLWLGSALATLLVALLIGEIVNQVVQSGPSQAARLALSWDTDAASIGAQSAILGQQVRALRAGRGGVGHDRLALEDSVASLEQIAAAQRQALSSLTLTPPSPALERQLSAALTDRARGTAELAAAVRSAIGTSAGRTARATGELTAAAASFQEADAAYGRFVRGLPRDLDPPRRSTAWIEHPAAWTSSALATWASALAGSSSLRSRAGLQLLDVSLRPLPEKITGLPTTTSTTSTTTTSTTSTTTTSTTTTTLPGVTTTRPRRRATTTSSTPPTTTQPVTTTTLQLPPPGSVSVLGPTSTVTVVAVVRGNGNVPVEHVSLTALLEPTGPGPARSGGGVRSIELRSLGPGAARYLAFRALKVVAGRYVLRVTLAGDGVPTRTEQVVLTIG